MNLTMRNTIVTPELTKLTASTDTAFEFGGRDDQIIMVINALATCKLTVKAGNHIQGGADHTVDVPTGVSLIKLDSGRFINVSGANKGKVVLNSTGTPSVGIAALV